MDSKSNSFHHILVKENNFSFAYRALNFFLLANQKMAPSSKSS